MQTKRGISGSSLKIIALISMLCDHTAAVLLGSALVSMGITSVADYSPIYISQLMEIEGVLVGASYLLYQIMRRVIGRIAFPIYCFLLVEGFQRTHDRKKYAFRLFLFALISELPFDLAFYNTAWKVEYQNVFFTLFLGFCVMAGIHMLEEKTISLWLKWGGQILVFITGAAVAELLCTDYGAKGIMVITVLYLFRKNEENQILAGALSFFWEVMALFAFIPIALYNGKKGLNLNYIFYFFYPAHLLVLYVLRLIFF